MMKKVVSLLLALVMALGLCSSALATGIGQEDDKGGNQQESGPVWPEGAIHLEFYENGEYYNGKGVDPGASVTFDALYVDRQHNTAITGFSVSNETSAGLNAVATEGGKLTVTVADNCEPGDKFVVLMVGETKYALRLNVNKVGGDHGGGPKWPTTEQFCFNGTDNDGETSFFNGTGIDQGSTVTFEKVFKDNEGHMQITSFAVDEGLTSKGLTATANGEALTVTIAEDCELGEQFVVIVADNTKYSMCFNVRKAGGNQGGGDQGGNDGPGGGEDRRTGTVTDPNTLENETTKKYLADYINYEGTGGQFTIKNAEIDAKTGLYKDEAARQAAIAAYNAFCSLGPNADGLYSLYVKNSRGQECWFYERMEELRQLADNGSGGYTDTNALNKRLRDAGYAVPVLGRDLKISFPAELQRGVEYDYTYDQTSGHLTVTVKKGDSERWLDAAQNSFNNDSVVFSMTLLNTNNKRCWQFWNGNNDDGTWEQFVNGTMVLEKEKMSQFDNGDILAVVNRENDTLSMNPSADDRNYRVLIIWANEDNPFPQMTKFMFTYEVKVEESFHYERAGVLTTGKVDMSRVEVGGLPENWTYDKNEAGVLKIWCSGNQLAGSITVKAPDGYKLVKNESYVANGGDNQMKDIQDDSTSCTIPLSDSRNTFIFTWKNDKGEKKQESLDVFAMQNSMDDLGLYDVGADGKVTERETTLRVTKPANVANPTNGQTNVAYDPNDGFFYTTFSNGALPTYEQLQEGVLLTPDKFEGATHFRKVEQSTGDTPRQEGTTAQSLVLGFAAMGEDETYAIADSNNNSLRTLAYVSTDYQEIGGIRVSYAATQGYRCKIVQWLKQETDGKYTVLGYSYVWGRNDAFISKVRTSSITEDKIATSDKPFVIGQGMELCCDRYPQVGGDGEIQYFQFRATGQHTGSYTVYIPYSYFGLTWEQAKTRTQKPVIKHYYEDHTWHEDIQGEYTEYGIKFEVSSFSPFVISTAAQSSSGGGYYYGGVSTPGISAVKTADAAKSATDYTSGIYGLTFRSTAAFSGFKGVQVDGRTIAAANYVAEDNGGIEVYLKAVYLRTLKDGRHTVTILSDAGNVTMNFTIGGVDSPTTFDAGIGAYIGMALASVGGMAWMRRRKR